MLTTNRDTPAWNRAGSAARQPAKADIPIDTERLIWDQEYRDEVRTYLKTDYSKT